MTQVTVHRSTSYFAYFARVGKEILVSVRVGKELNVSVRVGKEFVVIVRVGKEPTVFAPRSCLDRCKNAGQEG